MVTLSWVLTSMPKPFFMVRRLTVAAFAVDHGHLHVEARVDDTIELTQALD